MLGYELTIGIMLGGLALFGFANWRSRQDYEPGRPPYLPYNGLQFVGLIVVFLMAAHLITLVTGKPFTGRSGF